MRLLYNAPWLKKKKRLKIFLQSFHLLKYLHQLPFHHGVNCFALLQHLTLISSYFSLTENKIECYLIFHYVFEKEVSKIHNEIYDADNQKMIKKLNILNGNSHMRLSFIQWLLYAKYFTLNTLFLKKKKSLEILLFPFQRQENKDLEMFNIKQAVLGHMKLTDQEIGLSGSKVCALRHHAILP